MIPSQRSQFDFATLADRLMRLVRLDTSVFEDVRHDPTATIPAVVVAVGSTLLAGIGGWIWWVVQDYGDSSKVLVQSVILGTVFSVALWIVWLLVTSDSYLAPGVFLFDAPHEALSDLADFADSIS